MAFGRRPNAADRVSVCDDDCRYRSLYEGSQRSLLDMASRQASAVARVGRLRAQVIQAAKRAFPRAFADAERKLNRPFSDVTDEVLVAYLESFLERSAHLSTPSGTDELRRSLESIGVPVPSGVDLSEWATAVERHGRPASPQTLDELFAVSPAAPSPTPPPSASDGVPHNKVLAATDADGANGIDELFGAPSVVPRAPLQRPSPPLSRPVPSDAALDPSELYGDDPIPDGIVPDDVFDDDASSSPDDTTQVPSAVAISDGAGENPLTAPVENAPAGQVDAHLERSSDAPVPDGEVSHTAAESPADVFDDVFADALEEQDADDGLSDLVDDAFGAGFEPDGAFDGSAAFDAAFDDVDVDLEPESDALEPEHVRETSGPERSVEVSNTTGSSDGPVDVSESVVSDAPLEPRDDDMSGGGGTTGDDVVSPAVSTSDTPAVPEPPKMARPRDTGVRPTAPRPAPWAARTDQPPPDVLPEGGSDATHDASTPHDGSAPPSQESSAADGEQQRWVPRPTLKPQLFPSAPKKGRGRRTRDRVSRALPPESLPDIPVAENDGTPATLTDEVRSQLVALSALPRPVFTSDLAAQIGSHDVVDAWQREWRNGDLDVRFVLPKPRDRQRGALVVPQGALASASKEFMRSWWAPCIETFRGSKLYQLGLFFHRFGDQTVSHMVDAEVVLARLSMTNGLVAAVLVTGQHLDAGGSTRERLVEVLEQLFTERLVQVAVLAVNAEQVTAITAAVTDESRERSWAPSAPVTLSKSWEFVASTGAAVPLLGV